MSEIEHIRGKLIPTGETVAEYVGAIQLDSYYETVEEYFNENFYRVATSIGGLVYKVESEDIEPYDDIFKSSKNEDGTYNFEVKYYNGGRSFDEALEEALDNCK